MPSEVFPEAAVHFQPAREPLGHTAPLPWRLDVPLLGVPIRYWTNSETVHAIVEETVGHWRTLEPEWILPIPPASVRIVVQPGRRPHAGIEPFTYHLHSNIFLAASGESLMTAHYAQGEGLAVVTPGMVASGPHFRTNVVETIGLAMTMHQDRVAIHAAGVVRGGRTVLLLGRSGSGKSTLCYACLQAGFQLLAEDVVSVSLHPALRLWGAPGRLHLLPDTSRFFPELADAQPDLQANGKWKIAIPLAQEQVRLHSTPAALCLLARHEGSRSWLEPLDPAEVVAQLVRPEESGFDLFDAGQVAEALTRNARCYRLHVGHDPGRAVACLRELTE